MSMSAAANGLEDFNDYAIETMKCRREDENIEKSFTGYIQRVYRS